MNRIVPVILALLFVQGASGDVTRGVDQVLAERENQQVPLVSRERREAAARGLDEATQLRKVVQDQAWVVWSLDSLRRSGSADSTAWYELYDRALQKMQTTLGLTDDRYPGEMRPQELAALKEGLRSQAADGYLQSLDLLEQALAANPWDDSILAAISGVLEDLSRLYTSLEFRERAIELSRKRLAIDASNYAAHWDLADLLKAAGRGEEALDRYRKACRALRAFAWEDDGGSENRPVGRRRDHLAMLLRDRITLAMELGDEQEFRGAIGEWEPLASQAEQKEIAELRSWLRRGGGQLGQALRIDRAWKLLEQGREIEARELLEQAVSESGDTESRSSNVLALAELEFYRLELKQVALDRVRALMREPDLAAETQEKAGRLRAGMLLDLGAEAEEEDPAQAWSMYSEAMDAPGDVEPELCLRLGALLINRPEEALDWLLRAERSCERLECDGEQRREILRLQAIAYRRLDKPAEARRAMDKAGGQTR